MAKRPNILKLATKISLESMTYMGITYDDPEYKILEPIIDDDMCAIMMHVRLETNRTVEEVAKRAKKSVEYTQEQLDKLCKTGAVRYRYVDGKRCYFYPIWVPGIMEGILANREQCDKYPVLGESFEAYTRRRPEMLAPMLDSGKTGMFFMRVMPVMSAIENDSHAASYDEVRTLIENATAISVGPCSCRRARRLMGEGCGHLEEDMCMYLNDNALCFSEQGYHRLVSKEEAYEILQRAEDNGYVHQITNIDGENKIFGICNCAVGVCNALRTSQLFNTPNLSASAYVAESDPEKCVACGKCVETCPAGAVRLGQKLCTKEGPIQYPRHELPDDTKWGEDHWNKNYRNENGCIQTWPTGTAPCKAACPAHIAIQGYIKMAGDGRYADALKLIKKDNPFPAVCGSICRKYCEDACTRGTVDEPLAIDEIKKFIAEQDMKAEHRYVPPMNSCTHEKFDQKIAIIGGGPAGMSCAYFLAIEGYSPVVFEKEAVPGGMLVNGIPSFRIGKDVVKSEIDVLREMGVEFKCGVEVGKDITIQQLREEGYQAFYVAVGLQQASKLNIAGEDLTGVKSGLDFLREVNAGKLKKLTGDVVVIGGGNAAIDVARAALRLTKGSVNMYCLEKDEEMPTVPDEKNAGIADGVVINNSWAPKAILGEGGKVTGIELMRCVSVRDASGKFAPVYDENETITVPCSNVLVAIGQRSVYGDVLAGTAAETADGRLIAHDAVTFQSDEPDIFVGGDCATGPKYTIDAIATGREGAVSIHRFVNKGQTLTIHRNTREFKELNKDDIVLPTEKIKKPARAAVAIDSKKVRTMQDDRVTFTEEQIRSEASRCLSCGRSVVDPNKCIGCGICTTKCEFDAIHLKRVRPQNSKMIPAEDKFKAIAPYAAKRQVKIIKKSLADKK